MIALLAAILIRICDPVCQDYMASPITTTTTSTVTTTTATTTTTLRTVYASGYLGAYDSNGATVTAWPKNPGMRWILGGPDGQGALIATAKNASAAAGNTHQRFAFYLSLGDMDSACNCFEQRVFEGMSPSFILRDLNGNRISTNNGPGRVFAMDVGNPNYGTAWRQAVTDEIAKHGWQGVWADNVNRGCVDDGNGFWGWSAWPYNPRTGQKYKCQDYRTDMLHTLDNLRALLLTANMGGAWNHPTDPTIQAQVRAVDAVNIEDCVWRMDGAPQSETDWQKQLAFMAYANGQGVEVVCQGYGGVLNNPEKRLYLLGSELLTARGFSGTAQINTVGNWNTAYDTQLGAAEGGYQVLNGTYHRVFRDGIVAVNPGSTTRTSRCGALAAHTAAICGR